MMATWSPMPGLNPSVWNPASLPPSDLSLCSVRPEAWPAVNRASLKLTRVFQGLWGSQEGRHAHLPSNRADPSAGQRQES